MAASKTWRRQTTIPPSQPALSAAGWQRACAEIRTGTGQPVGRSRTHRRHPAARSLADHVDRHLPALQSISRPPFPPAKAKPARRCKPSLTATTVGNGANHADQVQTPLHRNRGSDVPGQVHQGQASPCLQFLGTNNRRVSPRISAQRVGHQPDHRGEPQQGRISAVPDRRRRPRKRPRTKSATCCSFRTHRA